MERAEAEKSVAAAAARLGVEAPEESSAVIALRLLRRAWQAVGAWTFVVNALVDEVDGDLMVLGVATGSKAKPNEVEDHWAYAQMKFWEREAMARAVDVTKLGIEQARLDQQERLARSDAEQIVAIMQSTLDALKAALLAGGAAREVVDVWYREQAPAIVARAIETSIDASSTEVQA